ncbi:structural cement protein Gp24 [Panacagrimonas sp.]|uniref:structural cement protein Gp24 n=1 Tax=Panacagrimonas sp. TaxID=2480088 RepID=UPI003B516DF2
MAVQSTYREEILEAVAGQIADMTPATLMSRTVETAAGIGFGIAVEQGTADKGCILFDGGTVLGVTVRERSLDANDPDEFAQYAEARVMTKGTVWVVCTSGCSAGDAVWVRPSNNTFQDDNSNSAVQIAGARWDTSAEAGALAIVRMG